MKLVLLISMALLSQAAAQTPFLRNPDRPSRSVQTESPGVMGLQNSELVEVMRSVEKAIADGSPSSLAPYFEGPVYISITGGEQGYFSANQALSILQNYFHQRKPVSFFFFSNVSERALAPYATGRFSFLRKGNRESAQVYVAFSQQRSRWIVAQLNIY
jgi:hypothetical protein